MSYVTAIFVYLGLWSVGESALRYEATQRPDVQCAQWYVDANGGSRPEWCPKTERK